MVASCLANMEKFYIQKYISHGITPNSKNGNKFIFAFCAWCEKSWLSDIKKLGKLMWHSSGQHSPRPHSPWDSHRYPSPCSASNACSCTLKLLNLCKSRNAFFDPLINMWKTKSKSQALAVLILWTSWSLGASMKCPQNYATGTGSHFDSSCDVSGRATCTWKASCILLQHESYVKRLKPWPT